MFDLWDINSDPPPHRLHAEVVAAVVSSTRILETTVAATTWEGWSLDLHIVHAAGAVIICPPFSVIRWLGIGCQSHPPLFLLLWTLNFGNSQNARFSSRKQQQQEQQQEERNSHTKTRRRSNLHVN